MGDRRPAVAPPRPKVALPLAALARRRDLPSARPRSVSRPPFLTHPGGQDGPRCPRRLHPQSWALCSQPPSVVLEPVAAVEQVALHPSHPLRLPLVCRLAPAGIPDPARCRVPYHPPYHPWKGPPAPRPPPRTPATEDLQPTGKPHSHFRTSGSAAGRRPARPLSRQHTSTRRGRTSAARAGGRDAPRPARAPPRAPLAADRGGVAAGSSGAGPADRGGAPVASESAGPAAGGRPPGRPGWRRWPSPGRVGREPGGGPASPCVPPGLGCRGHLRACAAGHLRSIGVRTTPVSPGDHELAWGSPNATS